jgi:hypothetical protein
MYHPQMCIFPHLPDGLKFSIMTRDNDTLNEWGLGFTSWINENHQAGVQMKNANQQEFGFLNEEDYYEKAAVVTLFTAAEAAVIDGKHAAKEGKGNVKGHVMGQDDVKNNYVGRLNTIRQVVKDGVLNQALYVRLQILSQGSESHFLAKLPMPKGSQLVGPNHGARIALTSASENSEENGQHKKHVDTLENNKDYLKQGIERISMMTVQCYMNPGVENYTGGEFRVYPARPENTVAGQHAINGRFEELEQHVLQTLHTGSQFGRELDLLEQNPCEDKLGLVYADLNFGTTPGQCVVFPQAHDNLYHGGAPVNSGTKSAYRFVLDVLKPNGQNPLEEPGYATPTFGNGYTAERTSIKINRY